ncbi:hypothetical protein EV363DRAFT_1401592 [Boletus edulis]|nr:hypothetical protein EV363DRAFT_1401592 [Boletus edulis]
MSSTTPLLLNGTYIILSAWSGNCVTFTDNISSPQVQTCNVNSLQQQWELQSSSNVTYSIRSLAYDTYIAAISPIQQFSNLQPSQASFAWYINASHNYIFTWMHWDIRDITESNPLNLNSCCNNSGNGWFIIGAPVSTTSGSGSGVDKAWRVVACVLIGLFGLLILVDLVRIVLRRRRSSAQPAPVVIVGDPPSPVYTDRGGYNYRL